MKLKYVEFKGKEEKEAIIAKNLEQGIEIIRLLPTQMSVKHSEKNAQTLHEFVLGRKPKNDSVIIDEKCMINERYIVVEEALSYNDAMLAMLLNKANETNANVLFLNDKYEVHNIARESKVIKRIKENDNVLEFTGGIL